MRAFGMELIGPPLVADWGRPAYLAMRQESETTLSITSCAALSSLAFLSLASTPSALPGRNPQGIHTRTAPVNISALASGTRISLTNSRLAGPASRFALHLADR